MLSPWTLFFLWAILGVSRAQVEGAMPSMKGHPRTQLQYRGKRHSHGAAKQLENPVETIPPTTTDKNESAALTHSMNTAEQSRVIRHAAISNWHLGKTLRTPIQQDHKMSFGTQTVQEAKGVSPPEANLEDSGTSMACHVETKGNICVRNTVQEILGGNQMEMGRQENGSAQQQQNQTHPRRVPGRPGNRPKPMPKPKPPNPYRPPLWHKPIRPKPKPNNVTGGSNNYNSGGSNNYNNQIKPSKNTNDGVSAHWTVSVPVLAGLLVVHHVS